MVRGVDKGVPPIFPEPAKESSLRKAKEKELPLSPTHPSIPSAPKKGVRFHQAKIVNLVHTSLPPESDEEYNSEPETPMSPVKMEFPEGVKRAHETAAKIKRFQPLVKKPSQIPKKSTTIVPLPIN